MKVSYKWLNEYFDGKLPPVKEAAEILTMNSSEVDGIEEKNNDYILEVKILPNMAHSCLCHRGIAGEFGALLDLKPKKYSRELKELKETEKSKIDLQIKIENPADCRRYVGRVIEGIKIGPSPEWLKNRLETLGQRSINNLVDATNFVMLELGQPMHVFDADKIGGSLIEIKRARAGEEMKTLDGKEIILDDGVLVISNNDKALAIAGIKGGTLAEIEEGTKNIVLESANFSPTLIRKTAQKIKIQTEASKRYENDLTPELAWEAMEVLTKLIVEIAGTPDLKIGSIIDAYQDIAKRFNLGVSAKEVEKLLGLKISETEIEDIFRRFNFKYKKEGEQIIIDVPVERLDLRIKEDLIEEILKVYGYNKLQDSKVEIYGVKGKINKAFYYACKIKKILADNGFSEIYGYTFNESGEVELANSVAPEKKFLRNNLTDSMKVYLDFNAQYSELVTMPQIKIFEISKIFKDGDEHNNLVVGVKTGTGNKGLPQDDLALKNIIDLLGFELKIPELSGTINKEKNIIEFNFDELIKNMSEPTAYDIDLPVARANMRYEKISIYPFSVRDVAVFVPEGIGQESVWNIIKEKAGPLLVKDRLFDVFTKKFPDGASKISYAFRLVLQSFDHTLTEEEINTVMKGITDTLNSKNGWQVR
jgi:phenylalanyl-tRNA synthetase beta chain